MASEREANVASPEEGMRRLLEHFGRLTRVLEAGGLDIPDATWDMLGVSRPRLHQHYQADEGVAAFAAGPAEWLCDGQFAVLPGLVLGFFTLGSPDTGPGVDSPTRVFWRPGRPDYAPEDDQPWLPDPVREPRGPDGERHHEYRLFLRPAGDERYLYAGPAGLAGWTNPVVPRADFLLWSKLPREEWERLGGYRGWRVTVDDHTELLAPDDAAGLERLLPRLRPDGGHLYLTRYEQDYLSVNLNAERGVVHYCGPDGRGHWEARDPAQPGETDDLVVFPSDCGPVEVPRNATLPRQLALHAVREFFHTGSRPTCVDCPEDPAPPAGSTGPGGEDLPRIGFLTEAEWLSGTDPESLLQSMRHAPAASWLAGVDLYQPDQPIRQLLDDRKLRLLAAACCRRVWGLMTDARSRRMVEVFERHTEGKASDQEWAEAGAAARQAWQESGNRLGVPAGEAARHASLHATTTAAAQLGPGVLGATSGMWAFAVACDVLRETARAVSPEYSSSSERGTQADLVRDIFGNPFRPVELAPAWLTPAVRGLVSEIYEDQAFALMPVLADALQEAGCEDPDILGHCRKEGSHVRGCWVVDLLVGKMPSGT